MSGRFRLTTLAENQVAPGSPRGMIAEHGLAVLIEGKEKVLFDTGQGRALMSNASVLGVDLSEIDRVVLSHGHYDHTGGLKELLKRTGGVEVVAHPDVFADKRARGRHIGIPFKKGELEGLGASFTLIKGPVEIGKGISSTGEVKRKSTFEDIEKRLLVKKGTSLIPDPLLDDLSLLLDTREGLTVVCGCAHSGAINTLEHARSLTGKEVYAVVGGIHLAGAPEARLEKTIAAFKEMGVERLELSHCTGMNAYMRFAREFGGAFGINSAGKKLEF